MKHLQREVKVRKAESSSGGGGRAAGLEQNTLLRLNHLHLIGTEAHSVPLWTLDGLACCRKELEPQRRKRSRITKVMVHYRRIETLLTLPSKLHLQAYFSRFEFLLTLKSFILDVSHPEPQVRYFLVQTLGSRKQIHYPLISERNLLLGGLWRLCGRFPAKSTKHYSQTDEGI